MVASNDPSWARKWRKWLGFTPVVLWGNSVLQRNSLIMSLLLLSNDSELPLLRNFFSIFCMCDNNSTLLLLMTLLHILSIWLMNLGSKVENSEKKRRRRDYWMSCFLPNTIYSQPVKNHFTWILYWKKKPLSLSAAAPYYVYHHKFDQLISWSGLGSFLSAAAALPQILIRYCTPNEGILSLIKALG